MPISLPLALGEPPQRLWRVEREDPPLRFSRINAVDAVPGVSSRNGQNCTADSSSDCSTYSLNGVDRYGWTVHRAHAPSSGLPVVGPERKRSYGWGNSGTAGLEEDFRLQSHSGAWWDSVTLGTQFGGPVIVVYGTARNYDLEFTPVQCPRNRAPARPIPIHVLSLWTSSVRSAVPENTPACIPLASHLQRLCIVSSANACVSSARCRASVVFC